MFYFILLNINKLNNTYYTILGYNLQFDVDIDKSSS